MKTLDRIRRKFHEGCADYGLIADGDRTRVGATLPPWGLYLNRIWYPEGEAADLLR